jgi:hypothetical protein
MFHQANLRVADVPNTMVNGIRRKLSLIETWTEVVTQEMTRLYVSTLQTRSTKLTYSIVPTGQ